MTPIKEAQINIEELLPSECVIIHLDISAVLQLRRGSRDNGLKGLGMISHISPQKKNIFCDPPLELSC